MNIPQQLAKWDLIIQINNGVVSLVGKRCIDEFEYQACAQQQKQQHNGHDTQPPGM